MFLILQIAAAIILAWVVLVNLEAILKFFGGLLGFAALALLGVAIWAAGVWCWSHRVAFLDLLKLIGALGGAYFLVLMVADKLRCRPDELVTAVSLFVTLAGATYFGLLFSQKDEAHFVALFIFLCGWVPWGLYIRSLVKIFKQRERPWLAPKNG